MKLSPKILLLMALFHLAIGLGWLIGGLFDGMSLGMFTFFADAISAPEGERIYSTATDEKESIIVTFTDNRNAAKKNTPVPVISLHKSSALNSFATYPPEPMDYAVLFRHLYEQGADKVYVLAPLVWDEEPDEIVKAAVGFELDRFEHKAVGLQMSESARTQPMPKEWEKLLIPPDNIHTNTALYPRADKLRAGMPQISGTAQTVGAYVENNQLFTALNDLNKSDNSFPLFVRWGNHILPTLPLIATMNKRGLTPRDILLMDDVLIMGKKVYQLNESACLKQQTKGASLILGTADIIITRPEGIRLPDNPEIRKLLSAAPAVIVSEPAALSDAPDNTALAIADTIGALLEEEPIGGSITISKASVGVQWMIVLITLIPALWALMFRKKVRILIWSLSIVGILILSCYIFFSYHIWLPFMVPVMCIGGVALLIYLPFRFHTPANDAFAPEQEEKDKTTPPLSPEKPFEEPNEVPIPHHSDDHSSTSNPS